MTHTPEEIELIRAVVERVNSYQDGATERTVESELRDGFAEARAIVSDDEVAAIVSAIESDGGEVDVESLLT